MSTRGSLTGGIHKEGRKLSTCKIIEAASGGPLVDSDGNIVGINYYDGEINPFLPSNLILECLGHAVYWAASKQDRCHTKKMHKSLHLIVIATVQKHALMMNLGVYLLPGNLMDLEIE